MKIDELILDNMHLVYFVLKQMGLYEERDSYYDIGLIGLVKAANKFDPEMDYKFTTYAATCIKNQILLEIRNEQSNKNKANINTISLDAPGSNDSDYEKLSLLDTIPSDINIEETLMRKEKIEMLNKAISTLDNDEKKLLKYYYIEEKSQLDIAEILNRSQAQISRKIKRIIEKLQKKVKD